MTAAERERIRAAVDARVRATVPPPWILNRIEAVRDAALDARHGTYARYRRGCRCDPCMTAARRYKRQYQSRRASRARKARQA